MMISKLKMSNGRSDIGFYHGIVHHRSCATDHSGFMRMLKSISQHQHFHPNGMKG
jgi:hypothetical protein